jgi:16S rRNA (adenine1518-N6/adenine1519-N6)-dimethyltransferase
MTRAHAAPSGRRPPLGQHFLRSPAVLDRIAREVRSAAAAGERVIEIGAGPGPLTRRLLDLGLRVTAIEIDPRLTERLRDWCPEAKVVQADVLETDLAEQIPDRAVVAGNLPYYITSPILRRLFDAADRITAAVLLVQQEVAERICAGPGSRDRGFLSVLCQAHSRPECLVSVPPGAFRPPPKVTSAVVRLVMESRWAQWGVTQREPFLEFVQTCFRQKRKTLRNNLEGRYGRERVTALPEARLRAEQLSGEQLASLWRRLEGRSQSPGYLLKTET